MNKIVRNINVWWIVYVDYLNEYYSNLVRCFNYLINYYIMKVWINWF